MTGIHTKVYLQKEFVVHFAVSLCRFQCHLYVTLYYIGVEMVMDLETALSRDGVTINVNLRWLEPDSSDTEDSRLSLVELGIK